jgi:hypothetical protein
MEETGHGPSPSGGGEPESTPGEANSAFNLSARAISDLPAERDLLGFTPLVEGLRALLNVRRTRLPLSIAITAPWGAGKSSVMLQLRNLLREPGARTPQERQWWTVDFPAWKYEHGERLWAALAKAVYEQPQRHMSIPQRVWFRLRVEKERLGLAKFLLQGIWPPLAAIAALVVAASANLDPEGSIPVFGTVAALAAFAVGAAHYWGVASKPFKRAIESYESAPDYDEKLGFTADADNDIRSLARVLAPDSEKNPHALAIFVDDLDRCTSGHVVELIEAMNQIFNSDGRHGCVFILGIDRELVATNIEVAYGPTVSALKDAQPPLGDGFGMHFLGKLVQISVTVPRPSQSALERLMASLVGADEKLAPSEVEGSDIEKVEEAIRREAPAALAEIEAASATADASPEAIKTVARRVRGEWIQDSAEVEKAEFALLGHLGANPREIKRFDNAFRLQLYVANQDPDRRLDFSFEELVTLGRWVALRLRWPAFAKAVDDEPRLLPAVEADVTQKPSQLPGHEVDRLRKTYGRWFDNADLAAFIRDDQGGKLKPISTLEPATFLRIT